MSDFVILNGFDRSGTSAISKLLSSHPHIELIMQPFNSGFIREKMYQILDEDDRESSEHQFFSDLSNNALNNDLIKSHWHKKHSSTHEYQEGKLHIIKTTINHFAQKWMVENYPEIDVWGIWREPKDIVDSIIRNNFYNDWYKDAVREIIPTIKFESSLSTHFQSYISLLNSKVNETAFLVAVRSYFFFLHLYPKNVINYEKFKLNSNYLNSFTLAYGLEQKDFSDQANKDLNIVGDYKKNKKEVPYSNDELLFMDQIFAPLKDLLNERHNIS